MTPHLRIIGDVHGEQECYRKLIQGVPYTIQIGDFDYEYDWLVREGVSVEKHRWLGGNHDNYDNAPFSPHYLGDFGVYTVPDFGDIFFLRGGFSLDYKARRANPMYDRGRVLPKNYWPEAEELTLKQGYEALELYKQVRPTFVIAHECPLSVVRHVTNPEFALNWGYKDSVIKTKTNQLLQAMMEFHRPKTFVFGHFHTNFDDMIDDTRYICVDICQGFDFEVDYMRKEYVPVHPLDAPIRN